MMYNISEITLSGDVFVTSRPRKQRASAPAEKLIWLPAASIVLKRARRFLAILVTTEAGDRYQNKRVYKGGPYPDKLRDDYRHVRVRIPGQRGNHYIGRVWWKPGKLGSISEED